MRQDQAQEERASAASAVSPAVPPGRGPRRCADHVRRVGLGALRRAEIASWVAAHFTATAVGSTTVYDLTAPNS